MGKHPVVHFELNAADASALNTFYSALFGWHVESMPEMGYEMVDPHAGGGIGGGFAKTDDAQQAVVFYVAADDLKATLAKAESLGAKTVVPITEIPNVVTFAQFADPSGNIVGLVWNDPAQAGQGPSSGSNPPVGWFEIMSPDAKALWRFYTDLFGWEIKGGSMGEGIYGEVDTKAGTGINGGIGAHDDHKQVTVYAEVSDIQTYLDKAESLGGKTLMGPMKVSDGLQVGMFADTQGVPFGLFQSTH